MTTDSMPPDLIPDVEFVENPEPRCPCVLLVDVSSSMYGDRIQQLNDGLATFSRHIKTDTLASLRTEVAIITFGSGAEMVQDFITADDFVPPTLSANGRTEMSAGISLALDKIEERKQMYRNNGIDYYRPMLLMLTDGLPTEPADVIKAASQRLKQAETDKQVAAFTVSIEVDDNGKEILKEISPRQPLALQSLNFDSMFEWLSNSMARVSASRTDDEITLDLDSLKDWAAL